MKDSVTRETEARRGELTGLALKIHANPELGFQETKAAEWLAGYLEEKGFSVERGICQMPTAFKANYGKGKPVIAVLAEYDALPDLSQVAAGTRQAADGRVTGHGCGHCALGTAAIGAAIAVKDMYEKHKLPGTLRVYGTPAEE
ncbi:MAG: amidohydrolase, partial [Chloroflexi bacterium]|nr:amidohydrolase [Chloroflexota bacterium]